MRLHEKANLAIDSADQGVEDIHVDVDDVLAVGALQMRMGGSDVGRGPGDS